MRDYEKAIADCTEAIRIDHDDALAYDFRGSAWCLKHEYEKAIADYNQAIQLRPRRALFYKSRALAWSKMLEYGKAIADYNEAVRVDPDYADGYNARARIWATCPEAKYRDGKKAVASATKACELTKWTNADYLDTLAFAHGQAGDHAAETKWHIKALELRANPQGRL
jgi:tetratricopeptide (TPR) repeat protein